MRHTCVLLDCIDETEGEEGEVVVVRALQGSKHSLQEGSSVQREVPPLGLEVFPLGFRLQAKSLFLLVRDGKVLKTWKKSMSLKHTFIARLDFQTTRNKQNSIKK